MTHPRINARRAAPSWPARAGLVVGFYLAPLGRAAAAHRARPPARAGRTSRRTPLCASRRTTPSPSSASISRLGQGPYTGLATLVAEELDADWSQMRADRCARQRELYKNLAFGVQGTGGSTAIANSYEQMRKAGATARAMLVAAAAEDWGVPAGEITVENGP